MVFKNYVKYIFGIFIYYHIIKRLKPKNQEFNSVLILAPHPDDEIIGLAGIALQTLKRGGQVHVTYLTNGEKSGACASEEEIKINRIRLSNEVLDLLGVSQRNVRRLGVPDCGVAHHGESGFDDLVKEIACEIERIKPDAVFSTAETDFWPFDHVACSQIAKRAIKQSEFKSQLWFYWVWTWYHIKPWHILKVKTKNIFKVDISEEMAQKTKLIEMYLEPKSADRLPWSGVLPKAMLFPFTRAFEIISKYD